MKIAQRALSIAPSLTLEITAKAKKLKAEGKDVVSFGAGEPDFNTPAYIRNAAVKALEAGMTKYTPASGTAGLKEAIANKLRRDNGLTYKPSEIVVSNGAKHALHNAFMALIEEGDEVIVPAPYWLTYPELVRLAGGKPVFVSTRAEDGFKLTPDELEKAIGPATRAIVLNNPNNPTGALYTKAEICALAKVLEKTDVTVISDEIYELLNYTDEPVFSIAAYSEKMKSQTVIVNGVSKTYSMTGWRIGFTAAPEPLSRAIANMQSHTTSNPNSIAQYASEVAYESAEGDAFRREMKESFSRRRKLIMDKLDGAGMKYIEPDGAFYVMVSVESAVGKSYRGRKITSAHEYAMTLLDAEDVAVIPCESFGADGYVRLSYAIADEDIVKGIERMKEFAAELV